MIVKNALLYLILRHLRSLNNLHHAPHYRETAHSLQVFREKDHYRLTWMAQNQPREKTIDLNAVEFYKRGDTQAHPNRALESITLRNNETARQIASEILDVPNPGPYAFSSGTEHFKPLHGLLDVLFLVVLAALGEIPLRETLLFLAPLILFEYLPYGRVYTSIWFLVTAVLSGQPVLYLLPCLAYLFYQFFDSQRYAPLPRYGLLLAALAALAIRSTGAFAHPVFTGLLFVPAVALTAVRSFFSIHFRSLPLVLPFFALTFFQAGYAASAAATVLYVLLSLAWVAYGCRLPFTRRLLFSGNTVG